MDEVVEVFAAAVLTVATAAFSHFGVDVDRPEPPRAEARAVRRTPTAVSSPKPRADCEHALRTYA